VRLGRRSLQGEIPLPGVEHDDGIRGQRLLKLARWVDGVRRPRPLAVLSLVSFSMAAQAVRGVGTDRRHMVLSKAVKTATNQVRWDRAAWGHWQWVGGGRGAATPKPATGNQLPVFIVPFRLARGRRRPARRQTVSVRHEGGGRGLNARWGHILRSLGRPQPPSAPCPSDLHPRRRARGRRRRTFPPRRMRG
jgi:hypothetical protein